VSFSSECSFHIWGSLHKSVTCYVIVVTLWKYGLSSEYGAK